MSATDDRTPFGDRLRAAMDALGPFCAGIDPHAALLEQWGLPDTVAGLERFALTCVEAFGGRGGGGQAAVGVLRAVRSAGVAVLERILAGLRDAGTLSLLDVKRGDIGIDDGRLRAGLPRPTARRCAADAITVSPYLGYGSLRPALDLAAATGRGVFVLALTSNPEGPSVQHATRDGASVAASVVAGVARDNADGGGIRAARQRRDGRRRDGRQRGHRPRPRPGRRRRPAARPGLGAQGGTPAALRETFGAALPQVLGTSSREVLVAGPDVGVAARLPRAAPPTTWPPPWRG